jgi:hypothetical protein
VSDDRADAIGMTSSAMSSCAPVRWPACRDQGSDWRCCVVAGSGAWARAWPIARPVPTARPVPLAAGAEQIVDVLAEMALACITRTGG